MVDAVIVETETPAVSAVSWPAIVAGGFVAAAMTLLLLALGTGIGFSVISPWSGPPDISTAKAATVGGIYMAVTAVMASALGGYLAGRLRVRWSQAPRDEVFFRDTAHGVLAWAFATVMGAALLASAATIVSGGAVAGAGSAAAVASTRNDITAPLLDRLFRPDYAALTGGNGQRAAGVFAAGRDLAADREAARRMLVVFSERGRSELAAEDRQYLAQMVAARTGPSARPMPSVVSPPSRPTPASPPIPPATSACTCPSGSSPRCCWAPSRQASPRPKAARRATAANPDCFCLQPQPKEIVMGRSILLWLLGVPIPVIILLALFWR